MKLALPLTVFLFIVLSTSSMGQLRADFTTDKIGGCSPLSISFTSTSAGTTSATTYLWDFGNGNTSVLKNPGAVFYEEKEYAVTLTIKEGTQTSTQTKTITVYKKPIIDFTLTPNNGCLPLLVIFTSSSTSGNGTITSHHWDFGDGTIQQSSGPAISHVYNFEQTPGISLTAVNNHGCSNTLIKNNLLTVKGPLDAGFSADKTILCNAPGTVTFNNTSTGPGTLTYQWEFGDGGTSADANPVYTYTRRGIYTVKLTVTSSEGCTDVFVRTNYINIADFVTNFEVPSLICNNTLVALNNTSTPVPTQANWVIDGAINYNTYANSPITHYFNVEGPHTVQLTNNFGPCQQSITKQIEIKRSIQVTNFISELIDSCGASPTARVFFKDTTAGAVSWHWEYFQLGSGQWWNDQQSHTFAFPLDGVWPVRLTVKNAEGCSSTYIKSVGISKPLIGIWIDAGFRDEGCNPLTVKFTTRTTDPIVDYIWDFGDGSPTSAEATPTHLYTVSGIYNVKLTYITENGCKGTVFYNSIKVREKPVANFTVQSTVCGNTPVQFNNLSTGYATAYIWDFGDNGATFNPHQYQQEGEYTVRLISFNGMCNDTIVKTNIIKVSPPFAKITGAVNTCDGTRGMVTFADGSRQANSWSWNFGDGNTTSYNTVQPTLTHTYARSGIYKVVLSVTNGACTVKDSVTVFILLKQSPILKLDKAEACLNTSVNYQLSGLEPNPHTSTNYNGHYYFTRWEYGDGTAFAGTSYNPNFWQQPAAAGTLSSYEIRQDQVRAIIVSNYFGCRDTTTYVPLKIKGVKPGFEIVTDNICFKSPVVLRDTSKSIVGDPIVSWKWNFGDGNMQTVAQGGIINHIYTNPGSYLVTLAVTDAGGCTSNSTISNYVQVAGPKAAFSMSTGNTVQLNTTVYFYNYSNNYNSPATTWSWDFGNGATSNDYVPSYTFIVAGTYTVTLVAANPVTGCRDTTKQTITVRNFNTGFTSTTSFVGNYGQCPPVIARFSNTSTNYTRLVWDFGDGFTLENQSYPSHIYTVPGSYEVTLFVYGFNGLTGTYKEIVHVNKPQATIQANDLEGCIGQQFLLNAPVHTNAVSYLWDFGNGQIINAADSFATHQFSAPGVYTPSLIVKDANGCQSVVTSTDKITIYTAPTINLSPAAAIVCKEVGVQLEATGAATYQWLPATGLSADNIASPLASPAATTMYTVNATDANGCKGGTTVTVTVPKPFDIATDGSADICKGSTVQLKASGAHSYQWINNIAGLSSTGISNPIATAQANTVYTIVGYDEYKCYSDTGTVTVMVRPLPTVNAGPDRETIYGSENILSVTNSSDVIRWNWTPADFLSCTNCPAPVSRPYLSMDYVVSVYNNYNCQAKDTVRIKAICTDSKIYIPTAFTPNNNGKNETFTINGSGISIIKSFRIYNRWGEIIFQKKNFYPNDNSSAWNGKYKGVDADAGVYVYFAEMECSAGEKFERKGTVLLVR